jgi:hypothetical protein
VAIAASDHAGQKRRERVDDTDRVDGQDLPGRFGEFGSVTAESAGATDPGVGYEKTDWASIIDLDERRRQAVGVCDIRYARRCVCAPRATLGSDLLKTTVPRLATAVAKAAPMPLLAPVIATWSKTRVQRARGKSNIDQPMVRSALKHLKTCKCRRRKEKRIEAGGAETVVTPHP